METLLVAFGLVFVAELGDKTQLVALRFGSRHRLLPVVTGVILGYMVTILLSVIIGGSIGAALPADLVAVMAGILFLGFAVVSILSSDEHHEPETGPASMATRSLVVTVAAAIFIAEIGDKSMIATITLAAQGHPVLVWIGATTGIASAGVLGVWIGRFIGAQLPARTLRFASATIFAGYGLIILFSVIR